jgi:hypothetical protein
MKKVVLFLVFFLTLIKLSGQSQGIAYQAILIDKNAKEIPGVDVVGNYLPNQPITIRFSIINQTGNNDYQEEHQTTTDEFGMINLVIGNGSVTAESPGNFTDIDWNGTPKNLRVEISLDETTGTFEEFSLEPLMFVPYAFHRNITATDSMIIAGTSYLNDQVTITADINGADNVTTSYPLIVKGSNQGIGIIVDGSRDNTNNFVTFWDSQGIQGRIEGQTLDDLTSEPQYIYDQALLAAKLVAQGVNTGIAAGASIIDPGNVGIEVTNLGLLSFEIAEYEIFSHSNLGVTYQSGSGDYAEWLPRLNPDEKIVFGQIVGVFGGKVSKETNGTDMLMVVSKSPIVLGNMPPDSLGEANCEKVAFMGQVPVWIIGKVNIGDFIVPYKSGTGFGKAIAPKELTIDMMDKIVGVAWSAGDKEFLNVVNMEVGLKSNEWVGFIKSNKKKIETLNIEIESLQKENKLLKNQMNKTNEILTRILPGFESEMKEYMTKSDDKIKNND